jgi:hypothetical protein|tara:strand:- start:22 stop:219 length:198 start_codon:yes stop_codon:yes gene_type:complete
MEESVLVKNGYEWDDSEEWWVREWTTNNGAETILEAYREDSDGDWWNIMVGYHGNTFYEEKVVTS